MMRIVWMFGRMFVSRSDLFHTLQNIAKQDFYDVNLAVVK